MSWAPGAALGEGCITPDPNGPRKSLINCLLGTRRHDLDATAAPGGTAGPGEPWALRPRCVQPPGHTLAGREGTLGPCVPRPLPLALHCFCSRDSVTLTLTQTPQLARLCLSPPGVYKTSFSSCTQSSLEMGPSKWPKQATFMLFRQRNNKFGRKGQDQEM